MAKKRIIFHILMVVFVMSLVIEPVIALDYTINEDFEDELGEEWELVSHKFTNGYEGPPPIDITESQFTLQNGYLESGGEFNTNVSVGEVLSFNTASIASDVKFGMWSITASFPSSDGFSSPPYTPGLSNFFLYVSTFEPEYEVGTNVTGIGAAQVFAVGFTDTYAIVDEGQRIKNFFELPMTLQETDTWYKYEILRTPDAIAVFVDSIFIGEADFTNIKNPVSVMLGSLHGTQTKFSEFKVSSDYENACVQLNYDCSTTDTSGENSSEESMFYSGVLFLALIYSNRRSVR